MVSLSTFIRRFTVAGLAAISAVSINAAPSDPSTVGTVRFVNQISSFKKLSLENSQGKNIKNVKFNKNKKPAYLQPGAVAFQIASHLGNSIVVDSSSLPDSVGPNHTYHVIGAKNELDQITAFTLDVENNPPAANQIRIIFVDAVADNTLDLSVNNVSTSTGLTFKSTYTYEGNPGAISFSTMAPAVPSPVVVHNNFVHSFTGGRTYVVVLGGTADPTDALPGVVNVYP